jgi:hypothetical protein
LHIGLNFSPVAKFHTAPSAAMWVITNNTGMRTGVT